MDKPVYIDGVSPRDIARSLSNRQLREQLEVMFKLLHKPSDFDDDKATFAWLCSYGIALLIEYQHRFECVHSTKNNIMLAIKYWWLHHSGNYYKISRFFEPSASLVATSALADLDRDTVYTDTWTRRDAPTWAKLPTLTLARTK